MTGPIISFGSFQLDSTRLELSEGGIRLEVGARACALLLALIQRKGEIVSTRDLLKAAWPGITVDEVNVRVHVTALRKVLRDGKSGTRFINTIPRRGYSFIAETNSTRLEVTTESSATATSAPPRPLWSLVGRTETLAMLGSVLTGRRIVTIVGPGGIGKTSVALAVAAERSLQHNEECVFVDLATATTDAHVAESVFGALALRGTPEDVVSYVVNALKGRSLLLLLDNCDRVVGPVARIANLVAGATANVNILATSREALRARGEYVHVLGPLQAPPNNAELTAKDVLEYSATRLFVDSARAHADSFRLDDTNATVIGDICRKLDGIPLALELAAATTDFLTVRELAERIEDRFTILTRGQRTAPPRHRTMLDALEWGHTLLSEQAAITMRRLAVFPSRFTLKDATAVATDDNLSPSGVLDGIAELQAKSLLTADISGDIAEFRFLETIRALAATKLSAANESELSQRRHALHTLGILSLARQEKTSPEQKERNSRAVIDNLRAAHNWANSPKGDRRVALQLLGTSWAIWRTLHLETEFITRARETFVGVPGEDGDILTHEMNVHIALTSALNATQHAPSASFQRLYLASATRALELAERVGTQTDKIRALSSLIGATIESGRHRALIDHAAALESVATSLSPGSVLERTVYLRSLSFHSIGRFAESLRISGFNENDSQGSPVVRASIGKSLASRSLVARNLWLRGELMAAQELRDEGMALPLERMDPNEVLFFLTSCAVTFPLWNRDIPAAEKIIETLERVAEETGRQGFASYAPLLRTACSRLLTNRGSYGSGPVMWSPATLALADAMTGIHCSFHRADDLARIADEPNWAAAEHLRSAGEHVLVQRTADCQESAAMRFTDAAALAREQGALFWELRASVSLARLLRQQEKPDAARKAVASVLDRWRPKEKCADFADASGFL